MTEKFDYEQALADLKAGKPITGKDSVLGPLIKQLTEAALEAELDTHLAKEVAPNRKNGKSRKTMKSTSGEFELETPRDRAGTFEPQLVKKHQRHVSDEIESKILSMYGRGMSYRDISSHVEDLYGISVSTATLSAITDKIIAEVKEWQQRPLDSHYPFVWMDAIHYKLRDNGRYVPRAVYTILGLNLEGPASVPDRTEFLLGITDENPAFAIADQFEAMARAGVKLAAMACNTAHAGPIFDVVLDLLDQRKVNMKIFHLVEETIQYVKRHHPEIQRVGVLATKGTYQVKLYDHAIEAAGLEVVNPDSRTRDFVHAALYAPTIGIKATGGTVKPEAIHHVYLAMDHLIEQGAEAIILGCTELPLAVKQDEIRQVPILDPALIMARLLIRESCPERLRKPG